MTEAHQSSDGNSIHSPSVCRLLSPGRIRSSHDDHHQEFDMPITANNLALRIATRLPTLVIDSRNSSKQYGVINNTYTATICTNQRVVQYPPSKFGTKIRSTIEAAKQKRRECNKGIWNHRCYVVLYSTNEEDEKRVRKTARKLRNEIRKMGENGAIVVKVLRGGLRSWIRVIDRVQSIGIISARMTKMNNPVADVEYPYEFIGGSRRNH